ncbi:MAG TPA: hypothetical protein VEK13_07745 [Thermoplasmata archaeon]|nr:hypothetical protein [Thermoplasmata archaeon]
MNGPDVPTGDPSSGHSGNPGAESSPVRDWAKPPLPRRSRPRRLRLGIGVGIAVAVGIVLLTVVVAPNLWFRSSGRCNPTIPSPWNSGGSDVLVSCGTRFVLSPESFQAYSAERFSDAELLVGEYSANGSIGSYLLNDTEFTSLLAAPHPTAPPAGWFWSCGEGTGCSVQAKVPPSASEYFLVLENFNGANVSVVWSQSLLVAWIPNSAA